MPSRRGRSQRLWEKKSKWHLDGSRIDESTKTCSIKPAYEAAVKRARLLKIRPDIRPFHFTVVIISLEAASYDGRPRPSMDHDDIFHPPSTETSPSRSSSIPVCSMVCDRCWTGLA
jgi:hypothetical protein